VTFDLGIGTLSVCTVFVFTTYFGGLSEIVSNRKLSSYVVVILLSTTFSLVLKYISLYVIIVSTAKKTLSVQSV